MGIFAFRAWLYLYLIHIIAQRRGFVNALREFFCYGGYLPTVRPAAGGNRRHAVLLRAAIAFALTQSEAIQLSIAGVTS